MNHTLAAARGQFAFVASAATFATGPRASRPYFVEGQDARLLAGWKLDAATAAFVVSGQDAAPTRVGVSDAATFSFSGLAASLRYSRVLAASTGARTLTGRSAGLRASRRLSPAASATFVLTGQTSTARFGYTLAAARGTFVLASPGAWFGPRFFPCSPGAFNLTEGDATFTREGTTRLYRRGVLEWPEDVLGCPLLSGYSQQISPMFERTAISEAPPAFSRFKQDESRLVRMEFMWTLSQFAVFEDFVADDLNGGMRTFNMRHIADGRLRSLWTRIASPYTFVPQADSVTLYRVAFDAQIFWRVARPVDWS